MPKKSQALIDEVSGLVHELTGIQLGESQAHMVHFRLGKRMLELGIEDPDDYLDYIRENLDEESQTLVGLITTHHTFFFREFSQFEYLAAEALPHMVKVAKAEGRNKIKIWSAACSYGHEVYSLAMFLNHHLPRLDPSMSFEILGTDVDPDSVAIAKNGVYEWNEVKEIPSVYVMNCWARGSGEIAAFVKAKDPIRKSARFQPMNLNSMPANVEGAPFDFIFCRNVFIYFKPDQIETMTNKLLSFLHPEGFFFVGATENLNGLKVDVKSAKPSIFRKTTAKALGAETVAKVAGAPSLAAAPAGKIKVFCIDDSATILTLLKKIFGENGFEVIGTAIHGLDAAAKLKTCKPDVVTLDIHMPEQNGIDYLRSNFGPNHPPVVMISSVSREDAELGIKALELGASDFIEKPGMSDITARAEEIRTKVRCVVQNKSVRSDVALARSFMKMPPAMQIDATKAVAAMVCSVGDLKKAAELLKGQGAMTVPVVVCLHGNANLFEAATKQQLPNASFSLQLQVSDLVPGKVCVTPFEFSKGTLAELMKDRKCAFMVLGEVVDPVFKFFEPMKTAPLITEDLVQGSPLHTQLKTRAKFNVTLPSMLYHAAQLLGG